MTQQDVETEVALVKQEITLYKESQDREQSLIKEALNKSESSMDHRLEAMNEFRSQLDRQAGTFITRESYETALDALSEKFDSALRSLINRHDSDYNSISKDLQTEREIRKTFQGSVNTWRWIAGFLGASGVAGVIALFITR